MQRTDRLFCLVVAAALALRLGLLLTSQSGANCDESVTGLMAIHIMQGKSLPVYMYGQPYNGGSAITAYLAAPIFRLAGISSFNLKLVPLAVSLAFLVGTYLFCRRFFGARTGLIAGILLLLDPGYLQWNLDAIGEQVINLLLSVLLLHVFYRIYFEGQSPPRSHFLFGFVAGLGYWNFTYILALAGGLLVLLALAQGRRFLVHSLPLVAAGAFLGALPVILNALFGPELQIPPPPFLRPAAISAIPTNAWMIARLRLPALFSPWNYHNVVFPYCWILLAVTAACVVYVAWRQRAGLITLGRAMQAFGRSTPQRHDPAARVWPLLLYVPAYLAVATVNRVGAMQARYLLPIHPAVTILTAVAVTTLMDGRKRQRLLAWTAAAVFLAVGLWVHADFLFQEAATNEDAIEWRGGRDVDVIRVKVADFRELIEFLDSKRIRCVYAASELRYKMVFETHERILASNRYLLAPDKYLTPQKDSYPPHTAAMRRMLHRGEPYAIIFRQDMRLCIGAVRNWDVPKLWEEILDRWRQTGGSYKTAHVSGFIVYYDFKREMRPQAGRE